FHALAERSHRGLLRLLDMAEPVGIEITLARVARSSPSGWQHEGAWGSPLLHQRLPAAPEPLQDTAHPMAKEVPSGFFG
ncbi:MAG: hypothetical protein WA970_23110, partial [Gammaproteobacteria bacterium]